MPCSRAIFRIHLSALIEGIGLWALGYCLSSPREHHDQRQHDARNERRRERKVEREIPPPDRKVTRQPSDRQAEIDQQPDARDQETENDERASHSQKPRV